MKMLKSSGSLRWNRRADGFALVVTLTMLSLLMLVGLGLLSLSSIATRGSVQDRSMAAARANARLGMLMALGELQRELGPDTRISAPGSQLLGATDSSAAGHWTGVYESWPETETDRPQQPVFRRWLISGDPKVVTKRNAATTGESLATETVVLVPATAGTDAVEAGLISTHDGGYGWWVADQNAKAKLGGSVDSSPSPQEAAARLQASPRAAHEIFLGDGIGPSDSRLDQIVSTGTMELLGNVPEGLIHDATAFATGLVTDVRSGGFRKDLNILLERPVNQVAQTPLYTAPGSGGEPLSGIHMGEMWMYHNIWGELEYLPSGVPHGDGRPMPQGVPYLVGKESAASAIEDVFLAYRQLTKVQVDYVISLVSRLDSKSKKYKIHLVLNPSITMWNPFDVSYHIPASGYHMIKHWSLPYSMSMRIGGEDVEVPMDDMSNYNYQYVRLGGDGKFSMRPGEVQMYSQGTSQRLVTNEKWATGVIGWNFGSGYTFDSKLDPYDGSASIENIKLFPNGLPKHFGSVLVNDSVGNPDSSSGPKGKYVGNMVVGWAPFGNKTPTTIVASANDHIFPAIDASDVPIDRIDNISTNPWPLAVFSIGVRTESDPMYESLPSGENPGTRFTSRSFLRFSPKIPVLHLAPSRSDNSVVDPELLRVNPLQIGVRRVSSYLNLGFQCDQHGLGYFGAGFGPDTGSTHVVTHSIPRNPPISLGAFQHAITTGLEWPGALEAQKYDHLLPFISHAIGNSIALSVLKPEEVKGTVAGWAMADHSFLANLALWDDYFCSSISPQEVPAYKNASAAGAEQAERFRAFVGAGGAPTEPLPNPRFKPWAPDPDGLVEELFPGNRPATGAEDRVGAHLLIDGAFNVNSTSVAAWRSVLSGLKDAEMRISDPFGGPSSVTSDGTAIPGLLVPGSGEIDENELSDLSAPGPWRGFRSLSDAQIEELAEAIVRQVRLRGPFLSLSDFVNRRPGSDRNLAISGALQSALDDPEVSINQAFRQGSRSLSVAEAAAQGFIFPEAEAGAKSFGTPGYVKQGDLLTSLAPLIAVRGDTFLIRSYGESRNAAGKVAARAWCEATVRRVPDYVDPRDEAHVATPTSPANQRFGRRFEIVAFRYLSPNEVEAQ